MSAIEGTGGNRPADKTEQYKTEFAQGLNLFQQSLQDYKKADEMHKRAKLKDVMDKALQIMNETASGFLKDKGKILEEKLNNDYEAYISAESDEGYNELNNDVNAIRDSINSQ